MTITKSYKSKKVKQFDYVAKAEEISEFAKKITSDVVTLAKQSGIKFETYGFYFGPFTIKVVLKDVKAIKRSSKQLRLLFPKATIISESDNTVMIDGEYYYQPRIQIYLVRHRRITKKVLRDVSKTA